eukprot:Hpha_TRINITY_DN13891_c0_g1::TRINITY_DN13891_c0_g1_i1::g.70058::m.70058
MEVALVLGVGACLTGVAGIVYKKLKDSAETESRNLHELEEAVEAEQQLEQRSLVAAEEKRQARAAEKERLQAQRPPQIASPTSPLQQTTGGTPSLHHTGSPAHQGVSPQQGRLDGNTFRGPTITSPLTPQQQLSSPPPAGMALQPQNAISPPSSKPHSARRRLGGSAGPTAFPDEDSMVSYTALDDSSGRPAGQRTLQQAHAQHWSFGGSGAGRGGGPSPMPRSHTGSLGAGPPPRSYSDLGYRSAGAKGDPDESVAELLAERERNASRARNFRNEVADQISYMRESLRPEPSTNGRRPTDSSPPRQGSRGDPDRARVFRSYPAEPGVPPSQSRPQLGLPSY